MSQNRRKFLGVAAMGAGALSVSSRLFANSAVSNQHSDVPSAIERLTPMKDGIIPISVEERKQRIAKAQELMSKEKIDGIFIEGTTSSFYFTGNLKLS